MELTENIVLKAFCIITSEIFPLPSSLGAAYINEVFHRASNLSLQELANLVVYGLGNV
tara:strand:+ start:298 stop:471 length:174 start_codon:yes stop_codon:yes gene_type:complete